MACDSIRAVYIFFSISLHLPGYACGPFHAEVILGCRIQPTKELRRLKEGKDAILALPLPSAKLHKPVLKLFSLPNF